jgi:hypothetical protein
MRPLVLESCALGNRKDNDLREAMKRETMSRAKDTPADDGTSSTPPHVALVSEALLEGWTRQQVIAALVSRIRRDEGYLAYRRATGRHTSYDDQVRADMRALALATCWLQEQHVAPAPRQGSALGQGEGGHEGRDRPEEHQP